MVAFSSSRRCLFRNPTPKQSTPEALAVCGRSGIPPAATASAASRRGPRSVETFRDGRGEIIRVKIGRWRTLAAAPQRRVAEVRELPGQRVAVRIERFADNGPQPSSEIWQLYDLEGRLEAAMQSTPDGKFALLTNYRTRQACRLVRNAENELETVETWSI